MPSRLLRPIAITILLGCISIISPSVARADALTINVYNGQSLQNAVSSADAGTTIIVHQGNYATVSLTGKQWVTPVTITAATGERVTVSAFWMLNTSGLTVSHLDITNKFEARYSSNIEISDSHIGLGVYLRDGMSNVSVLRNRIDGGDFGVWVYNSASTPRNQNITIAGNDISLQNTDNIQIGAADNITIEDNFIHDIPDNANHNDGIQLMGTESALIRRNRFTNEDEAVILKGETYLGPTNRVANVRFENNIMYGERGAGLIVGGLTDNVQVVNNTGSDNPDADVHIEGDNPNLQIWNNVVNEIWKGGVQTPTLEDYNCGLNIWQNGPHDTITTPAFSSKPDYHLAVGSCTSAGTNTGAPSDDFAQQARSIPIRVGAWQDATGSIPIPALHAPTPGASASVVSQGGYWTARADASVNAFGGAGGGNGAISLSAPIVAMAHASTGNGYWLVAHDGGVFSFAGAPFLGSTGGMSLNAPIVGMTASPIGIGYRMVASDGGVFSFGDAQFYGSMGGHALNKPIVGMTSTPSGRGYWLVASDGGIFAFGDAQFHGSMGGRPLNKPIVGMASTPTGRGYWMVASDGGIFAFGDAQFYGSTGGHPLNQSIVGAASTDDGNGYWLVAADGGVFSFGDASFQGSDARGGGAPTVAIAAS